MRLLVLGNAGVDLSIALPRLPAPGETLVGSAIRRAPGGKGLNQAVMAARAGATVVLCAPLGDDPDGTFVAHALAREPLTAQLPRPGPATDTSIVMVAADGENCIVTAGDCAAALSVTAAVAFAGQAGPGDLLLLQGNLSQAATLAAARAAQRAGARVMLNPAPICWPPQDLLAACWLVVANEGEARAITGQSDPAALRALGPEIAIVTQGAAGCRADRHYPTPAVHAIDSSGAGDAFCGVLAAALLRGLLVPHAIEAAQRAAAATVTRPGAFLSFPATVQ